MDKIAILIPCYNEEITIKKVIEDFRRQIPSADIYVYNNNSTDKTAQIAENCGAIVKNESNQGKGNVVRRMFKEIEADIYVMVDGDDTYPAESVQELIQPIINQEADMTVGNRISNGRYKKQNTRAFHNLGNNLVVKIVNKLLKTDLKDVMSGYRAFNKKFVKTVQITTSNFEVETEMTLQAINKNLRIKEIAIEYRDRPKGSKSKLKTIKDGRSIIKTIIKMH